MKYLQEESGKHFDPAITEIFLNLLASQAINTAGA
jgi:HD-GYP domain-containing protein (c-di-GMP phosphodiesterase class II)